MIQHGLYNRRIYLMKLHPSDLPDIIPELETFFQAAGVQIPSPDLTPPICS